MTKFVWILFFAFTHATAQEPAAGIFPLKDSAIHYEKIVLVDSTPKEEIYRRVKVWALQAFKSQKHALQTEDKEVGLLSYNTWFANSFESPKMLGMSSMVSMNYDLALTVYLKENKAKIVVSGVALRGSDITAKSSTPYDILNYRKNNEAAFRQATWSKRYTEEWFAKVRDSFIRANLVIESLIEGMETAILKPVYDDF